MCMLTFIPSGTVPSMEGIENGAWSNDDGHGWAIVAGNRIITGHSMNKDQAISQFEKARNTHFKGPAMFHSRWATHGTINRDNCHPFKVGRDRRTVLGHNGILPAAAQPLKGDNRSDTRKFAQSMLPNWGHLDNLRTQERIKNFLGGSNKILILTTNPMYSQKAYLFGENLGTWDKNPGGDIWYSNSDFKPRAKYFGGKPTPMFAQGYNFSAIYNDIDEDLAKALTHDELEKNGCPWCHQRGFINHLSAICEACNSCLECMQHASDCDCYTPRGMRLGKGAEGFRYSFDN